MGSTSKEDSEEAGDCKELSNRSACKGLFIDLHVVYRLMEGWIIYVYLKM